MSFRIIRNDITRVEADAIVNTANPNVAVGSGVDAAIYAAAGERRLLKARSKIGKLEPGEVGITPAFHLPAKYIIHSSGPQYDGRKGSASALLRQCYDKSLELAASKHCKSIAFPLMATGAYGFPEELGMQIAIDAFTNFLMEHEMEILLVVFGSHAYKISGKLFAHVDAGIDDGYVKQRDKNLRSETVSVFMQSFSQPAQEAQIWNEEQSLHIPEFLHRKTTTSLDETLKFMYTDSFAKHLQQLINKKGMKNSEVYTAANISKQYFSKLLKGQVRPSKEKMLALAVGLNLNVDEAVDFLALAGYAFSPISQTDQIVQYFIKEKEYSVIKIDIVLFDYGLPSLSE